ncbi:MAG: FeoA family protein [Anaerolineaceae bacterium]
MEKPSRSQSLSPNNEDQKKPQIPLGDIPAGQTVIVSQFTGGKEFINRIASMGFASGVLVTVLQNRGHGPMIVSILGSHLALGRHEVELIQVHTQ